MAKGDTKTNQYLDIAANGTRADLPTDTCCETRSQTLIREVAERIMDVEDEVEELKNNPDVVDIVATYADLQAYDTQHLTDKDIVRVLQDETHDGESTYYRYNKQSDTWTYVGTVGDYYTKTAADAKFQDKLTAGPNITISNQNVISATDTTYSDFTGTDGTAAGEAGLVPAPATTDAGKFLSASGLWEEVAGGGVTELTSADFDTPASNPTYTAAWGLEPGTYVIGSTGNVKFYDGQIGDLPRAGQTFSVYGGENQTKTIVSYPFYTSRAPQIFIVQSNGGLGGQINTQPLQTTGTSTTSVMSQNAVTSMVFADASSANEGIKIGANATTAGTYHNSRVQIGNYSVVDGGNGAVVVGDNAKADGATGSDFGMTALGTYAKAEAQSSIALGAGSHATSKGEINVGIDPSSSVSWLNNYGYNNSNYRLLSGLYDPQSAHDAATKGYVDTFLGTAIVNGGTTAPTTSTVGQVGTLYSYVDITGTTPAPKLLVCTAVDTTTTPPTYTWVEAGGGGQTVVPLTDTELNNLWENS